MADLEELVKQHAAFFDRLVEMVPAKFLFESDKEQVNTRYLKKSARAAAMQEMKEHRKEAKRAKLDPDQAATALHVLKQQAPSEPSTSVQASEPGMPNHQLQLNQKNPLSREQLLERLHMKIETLKQRKNKEDVAQKAKEWRQQTIAKNVQEKQQKKQTKPQQQDNKDKRKETQQQRPSETATPAKETHQPQLPQEESPNFTFGRIEIDQGKHVNQHHKKKPTKAELLEKAEQQRQELAQAQASADGKAKVAAVAWQSALARAAGDRVLDDPKLLRKSLKKERKLKEKSSKAWTERLVAQHQQAASRQKKRNDNLQARVQSKVEKKVAKREKKLLRAGFEGRKEGFIGDK